MSKIHYSEQYAKHALCGALIRAGVKNTGRHAYVTCPRCQVLVHEQNPPDDGPVDVDAPPAWRSRKLGPMVERTCRGFHP